MHSACALCGATPSFAENRRVVELERALRELTEHMSSVNFKNASVRADRVAELEETVKRQEGILQEQALRLREQAFSMHNQAEQFERQAKVLKDHM